MPALRVGRMGPLKSATERGARTALLDLTRSVRRRDLRAPQAVLRAQFAGTFAEATVDSEIAAGSSIPIKHFLFC